MVSLLSSASASTMGTAGLAGHLFPSPHGLSSKEAGPVWVGPDLGSVTEFAFYWSKEVTRSAQIQGKQPHPTSRWEKRQGAVDMFNLPHLLCHGPFYSQVMV